MLWKDTEGCNPILTSSTTTPGGGRKLEKYHRPCLSCHLKICWADAMEENKTSKTTTDKSLMVISHPTRIRNQDFRNWKASTLLLRREERDPKNIISVSQFGLTSQLMRCQRWWIRLIYFLPLHTVCQMVKLIFFNDLSASANCRWGIVALKIGAR